MKATKILFSISFILVTGVLSHANEEQLRTYPFQQQVDINIVTAITQTQPQDLISFIKNYNIDVVVVKSKKPQKKLNPLFKKLPVASKELIAKAEFMESYEGRLIQNTNPCCAVKNNTILIRDTALNYTLIHEFLHSILHSNTAADSHHNIEKEFETSFRRLSFYQKKLFDDPYKLLQSLWRRDIQDAQTQVVEKLYERLQIGQSQEVIIEVLLAEFIGPKSSYYSAERRANGLKYAEIMINNSIDIFNAVNDSVYHTNETVANLLEEIKVGNIPQEESDLNEEKVEQFKKISSALNDGIQPTKVEILKLKEMMTAK